MCVKIHPWKFDCQNQNTNWFKCLMPLQSFTLALRSNLIRHDYLSVKDSEKQLGGEVTGLNEEMSVKQNAPNRNDELLSVFFFLSFFISFCPLLLSSPADQISVILTSLVRRSWDTLRQCWERISVEFNLDQCFSPRRWNFFSSIKWVKYYSVAWSYGSEVWRRVLSVTHFSLMAFCRLSSGLVLFYCCQGSWEFQADKMIAGSIATLSGRLFQ